MSEPIHPARRTFKIIAVVPRRQILRERFPSGVVQDRERWLGILPLEEDHISKLDHDAARLGAASNGRQASSQRS